MNIYDKMSAATEKINKVAKNLSVGIGKSQYKAVKEGDVLAAVKPIEAELKIYSYPVSRQIVDASILTSTTEYDGEKTEKSTMYMRLETVYRFVNIEKPDEFIDITTYGDGIDTQDKAPGKAMTYADKYALLKAYKIETGDDPDREATHSGILTSAQRAELIERAKKANIDISGVAQYFKVSENELTKEQIEWAIKRKTAKRERDEIHDTI
jgi:ERF superfamily